MNELLDALPCIKRISRKARVTDQMLNVRFLLSKALLLISALSLVLCLFTGWLFYARYLKWVSVFEGGRYFDPETETVITDTNSVYGVFSFAALLISVASWFIGSKIKDRKRGGEKADSV